jgi:hypothetical protein
MSESFSYENLVAGSQKRIVQRPGTVRMGEVFSRGALIGQLTATKKWQVIDEDGIATCSEFGIAVEAVDSSAGEVNTTIYVEGEFNENHVIFAYGDTADDWREILAPKGIYLRDSISTAGV